MNVKVGDQVMVAVPPASNAGQDYAPAVVTHVAGDGTVSVACHAGNPTHTTGVEVYPSREDMLAGLAELLDNINKPKDGFPPDPPATVADVSRWVTACYRPVGRDITAALTERDTAIAEAHNRINALQEAVGGTQEDVDAMHARFDELVAAAAGGSPAPAGE